VTALAGSTAIAPIDLVKLTATTDKQRPDTTPLFINYKSFVTLQHEAHVSLSLFYKKPMSSGRRVGRGGWSVSIGGEEEEGSG